MQKHEIPPGVRPSVAAQVAAKRRETRLSNLPSDALSLVTQHLPSGRDVRALARSGAAGPGTGARLHADFLAAKAAAVARPGAEAQATVAALTRFLDRVLARARRPLPAHSERRSSFRVDGRTFHVMASMSSRGAAVELSRANSKPYRMVHGGLYTDDPYLVKLRILWDGPPPYRVYMDGIRETEDTEDVKYTLADFRAREMLRTAVHRLKDKYSLQPIAVLLEPTNHHSFTPVFVANTVPLRY